MNARTLRRILRKRDLHAYDGLGNTRRAELFKEGKYPKPFKLTAGGRAIGWWQDEIAAYQGKLAAARDEEGKS